MNCSKTMRFFEKSGIKKSTTFLYYLEFQRNQWVGYSGPEVLQKLVKWRDKNFIVSNRSKTKIVTKVLCLHKVFMRISIFLLKSRTENIPVK